MGLFRDRESELSGLERLVARLKDAARRPDTSAEEWPLAMLAYSLHMSEDPALTEEGGAVYADFVAHTPPSVRRGSLAQLGQFITRRRGRGWKALLLYALGESADATLSHAAATMAISLAEPEGETRFTGAQAMVDLLCTRGDAPAALLSALLGLSDLRLYPLLKPLTETLNEARWAALLAGLDTTLNSLSAACLQDVLEHYPALAEAITTALIRMVGKTPLVADLIYPIPTWAYENPAPQPLHAWSLQDYLPRLRPRLQPHLSLEQMQRLKAAFV